MMGNIRGENITILIYSGFHFKVRKKVNFMYFFLFFELLHKIDRESCLDHLQRISTWFELYMYVIINYLGIFNILYVCWQEIFEILNYIINLLLLEAQATYSIRSRISNNNKAVNLLDNQTNKWSISLLLY